MITPTTTLHPQRAYLGVAMSTTDESQPSREELEARIADLEERNRDLARIVGQQLAQECHLQAVLRDYATPAR